jgi:hypothetical protein
LLLGQFLRPMRSKPDLKIDMKTKQKQHKKMHNDDPIIHPHRNDKNKKKKPKKKKQKKQKKKKSEKCPTPNLNT